MDKQKIIREAINTDCTLFLKNIGDKHYSSENFTPYCRNTLELLNLPLNLEDIKFFNGYLKLKKAYLKDMIKESKRNKQ